MKGRVCLREEACEWGNCEPRLGGSQGHRPQVAVMSVEATQRGLGQMRDGLEVHGQSFNLLGTRESLKDLEQQGEVYRSALSHSPALGSTAPKPGSPQSLLHRQASSWSWSWLSRNPPHPSPALFKP